MSDYIDDMVDSARKKLTGWFSTKDQASGKGGDTREKSIDDYVDGAVNGPPNRGNQSTDAQNRY